MAGTIHATGDVVREDGDFKIGDRVAVFHPMFTPGGTYAEYASAPRHTVFKIPEEMGFEGIFTPSMFCKFQDT